MTKKGDNKGRRIYNWQLMDKIEAMDIKVDDIHECIYGNGKPERGMLWRLTQVEKAFKAVSRITWIAIGGVVLGFIGIWMNSL